MFGFISGHQQSLGDIKSRDSPLGSPRKQPKTFHSPCFNSPVKLLHMPFFINSPMWMFYTLIHPPGWRVDYN